MILFLNSLFHGANIFRNLLIAGVAGSLAAYFPARRAAKLNVLDAINHE